MITCTGFLASNYNDVGEGSPLGGTTFTLLRPSTFVATITSTGSSSSNFSVNGGAYINMGTGFGTPTETRTGVAAAGLDNFSDAWSFGFNNPPQQAVQSASYSLSLTFTAIPEPSAVLLFAIPTAALLQRRSGPCMNRN